MKYILQFLANVLLYLLYSWFNFCCMVCWYGKLPKVSPYHYFKGSFTDDDIYNELTAQARNYPDEKEIKRSEKYAIEDFLVKHSKFLSEDIGLFDEKGKRYGTQTLYSKLLDEVKKQYS